MLKRIKQFLKRIITLGSPKQSQTEISKYPYEHFEPEYGIRFNINNPIEEFRLKGWGGEKKYVQQILGELKKDDIFFDIGSSVGLISVLAAKVIENGKVISFEPDSENIMRLKENYKINSLNNYLIKTLAVGEKKGKMNLYTAGSNAFSPSLQQVNGIDTFIEVEIDSIDNMLEAGTIPYPTAIKIDIEGAEMMALRGMQFLLSSSKRPRLIFVEIHPEFLPAFNTSTEEIFEYLKKFDYELAENVQRDKQILCKLLRN